MKAVYFAVVCLVLTACASTTNVPVSHATLQYLRGKSVVLIQRETPGFVAMTSGKGMFAVAGVGAAVAEGNKMVEQNNIVDPAMRISRALGNGLSAEYGVQLEGETSMAKDDDVAALVILAGDNDYALDVVTNGWTYIYDGFNFGDYYVGYSSKLRLIDVHTGQVVSSAFCGYDAKKAGKPAVSHDTLLAEDAAYIKSELADATQQCVREFSSNLSIQAAPVFAQDQS